MTSTGFARNIPGDMHAELVEVTSAYSVLALMGPNARSVLEAVTSSDVSNAAFPFGRVRTIGISGCPVRALRITYVGELGYELHVPIEYATTVYDALMAAGGVFQLVNAGYRALESCRLEKGYRAWGADIGPDHTPIEAGLGWAVKTRKATPFRGREAIERQLASGVKKMLACFVPDDSDVVLLGRETIYRDGKRVGWLSSGGFGYTIGKPIGYGYVRNADGASEDFVLSGTYELDVARVRVPCSVSLTPLYDPEMVRVRA